MGPVPENGRLRRAAIAVGLAIVVVANVMAFTPFNLYAGNHDEFSVSLAAILMAYAVPALVAVALLGLPGAALRGQAFERYTAFLAALAVLSWLQGTFLVWDYGVLDGSPIPWLATAWRGVLDTSIWLLVLLVALYGYRRFGRLLINAAAVTFVIQLAAIGLAAGSIGHPPNADRPFDEAERQAMFRFSPESNVLHIVMDGFQSDIFAEIINDSDNASLGDALEGFTLFAEHTGSFPYTQMTVPLLVSGKSYLNQVPAAEFTDAAMSGGTILNAAAAAGYEIDIASQVTLRNLYTKGGYTNAFSIPNNQHAAERDYVVNDAARLLDLSLFRLTPHFVKALIYRDELWFVQSWFRDADYLQLRYFAELAFLRQLRDQMTVDRPTPVYKLFHVMLSHQPTVGNERCEYDGRRPTWRANVIIQARCGLEHVVDVLERMKELGVYDQSVIVLMGDHGAWIPPTGYVAGDAGKSGGPDRIMAGMAVPVLAVKPAHAGGPLRVSSAPTTIGDVPATVAALMDIDADLDGHNAFELVDGQDRKRQFFAYAYGKNHKHPGYLFPMIEYEIDGSPFDYDAWRRVRMRLPEGRLD